MIRPIGVEKATFKDMKHRGMARTGKKRNHFNVSVCEKASLRSPRNARNNLLLLISNISWKFTNKCNLPNAFLAIAANRHKHKAKEQKLP